MKSFVIALVALVSTASAAIPAGGCVYGTPDASNTNCVCIGESATPSTSPGYCKDATGACTIIRQWTGTAFAGCGSTPPPPPPPPPSSGVYTITNPSGSRNMIQGAVESLSWNVSPFPISSETVALSWVPVAGGAEVPIVSGVNANNLVFSYTVPGNLAGRQFRLKLVSSRGRVVNSPHVITIVGSSTPSTTYRFTSPPGTATWNRGTGQVVSWDVSPFPSTDRVTIVFVPVNGGSNIALNQVNANDLSVNVQIDTRFVIGAAYRIRLVGTSQTITSTFTITIGAGTSTPPPPPPPTGCVYGTLQNGVCVCIGESSTPSGSPGYCKDATGACTIVRQWTGSAFAAC